jgi:centrosomal protein CEP104
MGLKHSSGEVRQHAINVVLEIYKIHGSSIKPLLKDLRLPQLEMLDKAFQQIDNPGAEAKKQTKYGTFKSPEQNRATPVNPALAKSLDLEQHDARCEFCYSTNPEFANADNDALDLHYINKCLMLTTCKGCAKIVEVSKYANHLVEECEEKDMFRQCTRCLVVKQVGEEFRQHLQAINTERACEQAVNKKLGVRCPLCDRNFMVSGQ